MRSVDKGSAPDIEELRDKPSAKKILIKRIGEYCSYCERPINHMIELEHVLPESKFQNLSLEWGNLLLSCKYCNLNKSDKNYSRKGYLWPDRDNTILAFSYSDDGTIQPSEFVQKFPEALEGAEALIQLVGLNRRTNENPASQNDDRWERQQNFIENELSDALIDWNELPTFQNALKIAKRAFSTGYYSLWMLYFKNHPQVTTEIEKAFPGTYRPQYDSSGRLLPRSGGTF